MQHDDAGLEAAESVQTSARRRPVVGRVDSRGLPADAQFEHVRRILHNSSLNVQRYDRLPWIDFGHVRVGAWCAGRHSLISYSKVEDPNRLCLRLPESVRLPLWLVFSSAPTIAHGDLPANRLAIVLAHDLDLSTLRRASRVVVGIEAGRLDARWRSVQRPRRWVVRPATWQLDLISRAAPAVTTMARSRTYVPGAELIDDYVASLAGLITGPMVSVVGADAASRRSSSRRDAAVRFIEANLERRDLSASLLADHLQISTRQLSRDFADEPGGVAAAVHNARLVRAVRLLVEETGGSTVADVAERCGFSSASQFSKAFKRRFGVPPSRYEQPARRGPAGLTFRPMGSLSAPKDQRFGR